MIKYLIIGFLMCFSLKVKAQKIVSTNFSMSATGYSSEYLDMSSQNFYYKLSFVSNLEQPTKRIESIYILQFGQQYSKFTEFNNLKLDSLYQEFNKLGKIGAKEMNETFKFKTLSNLVLVKDKTKKVNIFQNLVVQTYQYEENESKLEWELVNESKSILGHNCSKAKLTYRGRNYIAWYATDIPINDGPYIFKDLPGLILEIETVDGEYRYTLVGIENKQREIYLNNAKSIIKTTRAKFRNVELNYHDNPGFFHGKAYNEDGSEMVVRSKPIPYNPIERE